MSFFVMVTVWWYLPRCTTTVSPGLEWFTARWID
jgi:hypothetical protein